jgi:molybdate transport system substrate-binding protein
MRPGEAGRLVAWAMVPLLFLAGCAASTGPSDDPAPDRPAADGTSGGAALEGELIVFAAASLTEVIDELVARFEDEHPEVDVVANLGGSQTLAAQLLAGVRGDVLAVADPRAMERVIAEGLAQAPVDFAVNQLEIVVEPGNPLGVATLADLARDDLVLVLPSDQAAAGRYAADVLAEAGVEVTPSSLEADVRAATSRVAMGEADATIVFRSDRLAAGERVEGVVIPEAQNVTARYPVAVLADAPNPAAATAFVELLRSAEGRVVLEAAGLTVPR